MHLFFLSLIYTSEFAQVCMVELWLEPLLHSTNCGFTNPQPETDLIAPLLLNLSWTFSKGHPRSSLLTSGMASNSLSHSHERDIKNLYMGTVVKTGRFILKTTMSHLCCSQSIEVKPIRLIRRPMRHGQLHVCEPSLAKWTKEIIISIFAN